MKTIGIVLLAFTTLAASAETWYLKVNNTSDQKNPFTKHASALWTNELGAAASTIAAGDLCFVAEGRTLGMASC